MCNAGYKFPELITVSKLIPITTEKYPAVTVITMVDVNSVQFGDQIKSQVDDAIQQGKMVGGGVQPPVRVQ